MTSQALARAVHDVLSQGLSLLNDCSPELYTRVAGAPFEASIGQHYRHVLDHFLCLTAAASTDRVDYDQRGRDKQVETDLEHARRLTRMLMHVFQYIGPVESERSCVVSYSIGYQAKSAEDITTTYGREVAYCISHAVHHFAIIKLLCAHLDLTLPAEFGVAPSTLKYRTAQQQVN